jgi:glutamate/tyrosine decarboxylase-like PLP-dependent enzyme
VTTEDRDPFADIIDEFYPYRREFPAHTALPATGRPRDEVLAELRTLAAREDAVGDAGRCSGSIYSGDHEHYAFLADTFEPFAHANVLQRDMYPSATKFEAEIIAMAAAMLHGAPVGVLTSGGSESLLSAVLAYREQGRERGITRPNLVMPTSAHVALDKAGHAFGVEVRKAPLTDRWVADVDAMAELIDDDTVALVASAGSYPYGLVDDVPAIAALAQRHGIGLHVDGCLGGFLLPWGERLGVVDVPPWDFRVPGVTSISADTHKFGYGLKGTSVLLYRDPALRRHQYFVVPDWPGGLYVSPGLAGSRSGGLLASTWAAMVTLGEAGYLEAAAPIFASGRRLRDGIAAMPELEVLGDPTFLVAFRTRPESGLDVFHVNDGLVARGWRLNGLHLPAALHFCVTRPSARPEIVEAFLADLGEAVDEARRPARATPRSGALYGMGGTPQGNAGLNGLLTAGLDLMVSLPPEDGAAL